MKKKISILLILLFFGTTITFYSLDGIFIRMAEKICAEKGGASCAILGILNIEYENEEMSFSLFDRACSLGHADSCHYLGVITHLGLNGFSNKIFENFLFSRACDLGSKKSCEFIGKVSIRDDAVKKEVESDKFINILTFTEKLKCKILGDERSCNLLVAIGDINEAEERCEKGKKGSCRVLFMNNLVKENKKRKFIKKEM